MLEDGKLVPELVALNEGYKRAFLEAFATFGLHPGILDQIKSPNPYAYKLSPSLETVSNGPQDALELPPHFKNIVFGIYPGRRCFVERIRISDHYGDLVVGFEDDPRKGLEESTVEISRLQIITAGDCSYHKTVTKNGERDVTVEHNPLTIEAARELVKLPGLIASHYLATASFRKKQIVVFERDMWAYMARTGRCPYSDIDQEQ